MPEHSDTCMDLFISQWKPGAHHLIARYGSLSLPKSQCHTVTV